MKIIPAGYEIWNLPDPLVLMKHLERCGRASYKSEGKVTEDSYAKFLRARIDEGHESVLEHISFTVCFTVDRGITHEFRTHRIGSYTMESTRYCNYANDRFENEITVIQPCMYDPNGAAYQVWKHGCERDEATYLNLVNHGVPAQYARGNLPHSIKADLVTTYNIREWRHFLRLRTADSAHPQAREVTIPLLLELQLKLPILFADIPYGHLPTYWPES